MHSSTGTLNKKYKKSEIVNGHLVTHGMLHVDQLKEALHSRNFLALVRRYFLDKLNRHLGRMRIPLF